MEKLIKLHRDLFVVEYFFWGRTSNGGEPKALSIFLLVYFSLLKRRVTFTFSNLERTEMCLNLLSHDLF